MPRIAAVARKRDPLRGTAEIALAVGAVVNRYKMAIMAIGLGATGKTTLLRWLCERALERNDDDLALATVDPVNRELGHYFPAAMAPHTQDPAQVTVWLEQLLAMIHPGALRLGC